MSLSKLSETRVEYQISILISNQERNVKKMVMKRKLSHIFTEDQSDWGFAHFISKRNLLDAMEKSSVNDEFTILCEICVGSRTVKTVPSSRILSL